MQKSLRATYGGYIIFKTTNYDLHRCYCVTDSKTNTSQLINIDKDNKWSTNRQLRRYLKYLVLNKKTQLYNMHVLKDHEVIVVNMPDEGK